MFVYRRITRYPITGGWHCDVLSPFHQLLRSQWLCWQAVIHLS